MVAFLKSLWVHLHDVHGLFQTVLSLIFENLPTSTFIPDRTFIQDLRVLASFSLQVPMLSYYSSENSEFFELTPKKNQNSAICPWVFVRTQTN